MLYQFESGEKRLLFDKATRRDGLFDETHVGNILAKLGARDRIQAVIYTYETGFINSEPEANEPT